MHDQQVPAVGGGDDAVRVEEAAFVVDRRVRPFEEDGEDLLGGVRAPELGRRDPVEQRGVGVGDVGIAVGGDGDAKRKGAVGDRPRGDDVTGRAVEQDHAGGAPGDEETPGDDIDVEYAEAEIGDEHLGLGLVEVAAVDDAAPLAGHVVRIAVDGDAIGEAPRRQGLCRRASGPVWRRPQRAPRRLEGWRSSSRRRSPTLPRPRRWPPSDDLDDRVGWRRLGCAWSSLSLRVKPRLHVATGGNRLVTTQVDRYGRFELSAVAGAVEGNEGRSLKARIEAAEHPEHSRASASSRSARLRFVAVSSACRPTVTNPLLKFIPAIS